jgi:F-type H+-transporting ATPase subunit b
MIRRICSPTATTVFLTLALAAGQAMSAEPEAEHGAHATLHPMPTVAEGVITGAAAIIVFLIVLAFLSIKVWPKISKGLDDRSQKIRSEIEAAEKARADAKAALAQYEKSLAEARAEAQKMLEGARTQQQALAAELRAKSEIELTALKDRAKRDIEAAKRAAVAEVYNVAANQAALIASKILRREVNAGDQQRLVEESLGELQAAAE